MSDTWDGQKQLKMPSAFIRPANCHPDSPLYAPERDVSLQASRMILNCEIAIIEGGEELLREFMDQSGREDPSAAKAALQKTTKHLMAFLADAQGAIYQQRGEWVRNPKPKSYEQALSLFKEATEADAVRFVFQLLSVQLLDYVWFGERSAAQMDSETKLGFNELVELWHTLSLDAWEIHKNPKLARERFKSTIRAAHLSGMSEGTMHTIISKVIADEEF